MFTRDNALFKKNFEKLVIIIKKRRKKEWNEVIEFKINYCIKSVLKLIFDNNR